jgi:hypothetical protein
MRRYLKELYNSSPPKTDEFEFLLGEGIAQMNFFEAFCRNEGIPDLPGLSIAKTQFNKIKEKYDNDRYPF